MRKGRAEARRGKRGVAMTFWHWIIDDPVLSAHEKLVALTIVRHQHNGNPTNVSQARIAALSGLSIREVKARIASMQDKGYPIVLKTGKGRHRTNLYRVEQIQGLIFSRANAAQKGAPCAPLNQEKGHIVPTEVRKTLNPTTPTPSCSLNSSSVVVGVALTPETPPPILKIEPPKADDWEDARARIFR